MSNELNHQLTTAVAEFIEKFDARKDPAFWEKMIEEEAREVREAVMNLYKELADLQYVAAGYVLSGGTKSLDVLTVEKIGVIPALVVDGVELDVLHAVFDEVHRSNMSKANADGTVSRREDGKVLKGENYTPADVEGVFKRFEEKLR